jgi:hypothetical protein
MARRPLLATLGCTCVLLSACLEEQRYAVEREMIRLPADAAPAFVDENDDPVFVAARSFELQIRPPRDEFLQQLAQQAQGRDLPFPRLPWVQEEDLELQVDYAIENRSKQDVSVMLFVDGQNEFHVYTPGPLDLHQWERRFLVQAETRIDGVITERELEEIAYDLATVVNGAPNSAQIVHPQSQSSLDPRAREFIPVVIPGLVALRIGLQTGQAAELRLRVSVRVQDHGDRVSERGEPRWDLPEPEAFVPIIPEEVL